MGSVCEYALCQGWAMLCVSMWVCKLCGGEIISLVSTLSTNEFIDDYSVPI